MTEERGSVGRDARAEVRGAADPTLGSADELGLEGGDLSGKTFPDTVDGPRLVLFQREDGTIELQWRLDPVAVEHARAAFSAAADPRARLLLKGLDRGDRAVAIADLDGLERLADGVARYEVPNTEGPLQAEIGLGDAAGGWMLIARSNRLEAVGPVGAAFLHETPADDMGGPEATASELISVATDKTKALPTLPGLEPEFPLVPPPAGPSPRARETAEQVDAVNRAQAAALQLAADQDPGVREAAQPVPGEGATDQVLGIIAQTNGRQEDGALIMMPTDAAGSGAPGVSTPETLSAGAPILQRPADGAWALADRDQTGQRANAGGSGPILPPRLDQGVELYAELIVRGSAPPGRVLVLGGHRYLVGPGGRFQLRVPVTDTKLIEAALGQLERLPVSARGADDEDLAEPFR